MPINPEEVVWDSPGGINPEEISWDKEQKPPQRTGLYDAPTMGEAAVNLVGAGLEPVGVLASGALATPIAGWAGIIAGLANKLGLTEADAADVVRSWQEKLTYKPVTEGGRLGTEYGVPGALAKVGEFADRVGGKVSDASGSPALGVVANVGLQAAIPGVAARGLRVPPRTPSILETEARKGIVGVIEKHVDPRLPGGKERATSRIFRDVVGEKAPEVAAALENPPANPLGIPRSAAEIAANVGSTEFAALQRGLERHQSSPYFAFEKAAEAARLEQLRKIGGTEKQLADAIKKRETEARVAYEEAGAEIVRADTELNVILNRPSTRKAIARAKEIAEERGQAFDIGESYPVRSLHYVKMALDDMLKTPEQFGIGKAELGAINATKQQLVKWLAGKSERYERARSDYAKASVPINQMQIGQALESKLTGPLTGERAQQFAQAARDSAGLIKKSTGHPRYTQLSEVLSKQQMEIVDALVENLKTKSEFEAQAKAGGFAAQERLQKTLPYIPPPGMFHPGISVARNYINRLSAASSDRVLHFMAEIFRDPSPKNVAILLRKATPQERAVINEVRRLGYKAFVGASAASAQANQPATNREAQ